MVPLGLFQETYDAEYKEKFEAAGITYFYSLIDDIVGLLEDILEGVVVLLGDGILCAEQQILLHVQCIVEAAAGKAELVFTGADGSQQRATVFDFEGAGVLQGQYNKDDSIRSFARSCFTKVHQLRQVVQLAAFLESARPRKDGALW